MRGLAGSQETCLPTTLFSDPPGCGDGDGRKLQFLGATAQRDQVRAFRFAGFLDSPIIRGSFCRD
jgi:hypothetical protein